MINLRKTIRKMKVILRISSRIIFKLNMKKLFTIVRRQNNLECYQDQNVSNKKANGFSE